MTEGRRGRDEELRWGFAPLMLGDDATDAGCIRVKVLCPIGLMCWWGWR